MEKESWMRIREEESGMRNMKEKSSKRNHVGGILGALRST